jgi:glycosyltransferase involved in cell wall biosynthesis
MRILALATTLDRPEAAIFAGLHRMGTYVHVVGTPSAEHRATLEEAGVPITQFSFRNRLDIGGMLLLRRLTRTLSIDVVYALSNRALSAAVIALWNRPVKIAAYRGTVGHISWFDPSCWVTYLNPRVSKILCVSKAVEEYLASVGIPRERTTTIYKGHDIEWYRSTPPERSEFGIPKDAFVVGCTAVMRAVKGIDDLVNAVALLRSKLPNLHLLLIGSIKDPDIKHHIEQFPEPDRIHLTGFRDDATRLATLADVVVMASKNREGFPKSVIEAMSQGVPAIVTAVGGMPELVDHGNAGLMVAPMEPSSIADAISLLHNDPELRVRLGKAAQERIATAFNINHTTAKMHAVFAELTSQLHQERRAKTSSSRTDYPQ